MNFGLSPIYGFHTPIDLNMQNAACWKMTVPQAFFKSIAVLTSAAFASEREESAAFLFCLKFSAQNCNGTEQWIVEHLQSGCRHLIAGWLNLPSSRPLHLPYVWLRNNLLDSGQIHLPNICLRMFYLKLLDAFICHCDLLQSTLWLCFGNRFPIVGCKAIERENAEMVERLAFKKRAIKQVSHTRESFELTHAYFLVAINGQVFLFPRTAMSNAGWWTVTALENGFSLLCAMSCLNVVSHWAVYNAAIWPVLSKLLIDWLVHSKQWNLCREVSRERDKQWPHHQSLICTISVEFSKRY